MQRNIVCVGMVSTFLVVCSTSAQLVQVPKLSEFGNSNNAYPFSPLFGSRSVRYQQIYASSAFPHGGIIDKIMFRNDEIFRNDYPPADIDLQVAFAYAATTVDTASPIFADNIGDGFTIVLDEVITKSYDDSVPTDMFDFVLHVDNTFNYDPTLGELLVQVLVRNRDYFAVFDASLSPQQSVTTRIFAALPTSTMGEVGGIDNQPFGLVTQFEFAIPEPSAFALLGVAGIFATLTRRQRIRSPKS
jgi:hypothetical protein